MLKKEYGKMYSYRGKLKDFRKIAYQIANFSSIGVIFNHTHAAYLTGMYVRDIGSFLSKHFQGELKLEETSVCISFSETPSTALEAFKSLDMIFLLTEVHIKLCLEARIRYYASLVEEPKLEDYENWLKSWQERWFSETKKVTKALKVHPLSVFSHNFHWKILNTLCEDELKKLSKYRKKYHAQQPFSRKVH